MFSSRSETELRVRLSLIAIASWKECPSFLTCILYLYRKR
ncbi:MAG: hypothetical protein ANABAC_1656 [Anaerolineae bacterium]|nr:MAG: hypothetical protein ANABAC_1656 [Anaerolineae bacterium]